MENETKESGGKALIAYGSRLYRTWWNMRQRCLNPKHPNYRHYGGRGITICERWLNSLEDFASDVGEPPEGTSIDRIDNDGNYEPGNVRWATTMLQANNARKRSGRPPTAQGTPPIRGQTRWHDDEWAEIQAALKESGETYAVVVRRLMLKWARRKAPKSR